MASLDQMLRGLQVWSFHATPAGAPLRVIPAEMCDLVNELGSGATCNFTSSADCLNHCWM